jgi:hypothetical protein
MRTATRPTNMPASLSSPRKVKTTASLATPRHRIQQDTNRNSDINEYGERQIFLTKNELYYSDLLDDIADQVKVPGHMRRKMISAMLETDNPSAYHELTHFHKHFMTSSEARQARFQRQKANMEKPQTLHHTKPHVNQDLFVQDDKKIQELFTEKLIKVKICSS